MELTASEVWTRILAEARSALPEQAYQTWLAPTEAVAISQDLLVVSTPNPFAVDWVEDKYAELLGAIGERLFGRHFTFSVQYHGPPDQDARTGPPELRPPEQSAPVRTGSAEPRLRKSRGGDVMPDSPLNERYTFDRFVVGDNNQLAAAAAHAVAEAPARMYNPLFIYGGVGLGKTHLMQAIGHVTLAREGNNRVAYLSSEEFTNELVTAIQEGRMADFRRVYRAIDVLLVDDIQFLEGKERTQEEFFHTFNALHDAQRQIVITSDRPPKEIGLEDRLISRFEWGLVTDIRPPDLETRMAILQKKVEEDRIEIPAEEEVLSFLARNCTSSVRELEGAVIRLLAFSSVHQREINLDLARESLGRSLEGGGRSGGDGELSPEWIRDQVAKDFGVTIEGLKSRKRTKDLTVPRQVAMYLIKERFQIPLAEIGRLFGGRDHSTVIHSIAKVEDQLAEDPELRSRIERIRGELG